MSRPVHIMFLPAKVALRSLRTAYRSGLDSTVLEKELYSENHMQAERSSHYQADEPEKRAKAVQHLGVGIDTIRPAEN